MPDKTLSDALNANKAVTDFRTGKYTDGYTLDMYNETVDAIANGTIAVGDLLTRVVPTATQGLRVNKVASGGAGTFLGAFRLAGICVKAAVIGGQTQYVKYGFCLAQVGAGAPVIDDMAVCGVTAGQVDAIAGATGITAATFVGNVLGNFLGTKDASNLAALWYERA